MAAAQAPDLGFSRTLSLVGVLVLAKALVLAGRDLTPSWSFVPAFFWHDVAVGALFAVLEVVTRRHRSLWVLYGVIAAYAALNVVVTRALSSPLTFTMWRAAGGALADSIGHYVTPLNVALMLVVLTGAVVFPYWIRRWPIGVQHVTGGAILIVGVLGPVAQPNVESRGLHRNAVTALTSTLRPRLGARDGAGAASPASYRSSPFDPERRSGDLTSLRGTAAGFNVVVVVLESTGAIYLKPYGASDDPTPNFTSLSQRAILFEHAYAVYPESIKGLFATMCAQAPAMDVSAEAHAAASCTPLPRKLSEAGYRTALFHSGRLAYLGMKEIVGAQGFDTVEDAGAIGGVVESSFGVDEPSTVARMLSWVDSFAAGQRFFMTYLPIAGHHPYVSPEVGPFTERGELGAYKNALHYADRTMGAFIDGLRQRKLFDRTLFVIFGDHGEAFEQHAGNTGHTQFIYEENIKVPMLLSIGNSSVSERVGRVASVIDVAPTIVDLLGLPAVGDVEGVSLLEPRERMALFFTDYALGWLGLRDGCWKFLFEVEGRRSELYDVCRDPAERVNRAAEFPDRVAAYRERVQDWAATRRAAVSGKQQP